MAALAAMTHDFADRARDATGRLFVTPRSREAAVLAGLVVFGLFWGALVAVGGLGAALLCVSMIAGLYCLFDFRAGVTLLIIIMPISSSVLFPHAMFGLTGLNPLNLLLAITLAVYLMSQIGHGALEGLVPRPLLWLYIVPFVFGGLMGMRHVHEIPNLFHATDMIFFDTPASYLRDMVMKPLNLVLYAILVGAAVGRSKQPEKFVTPMFLSVFAMAALAITFVVSSGVGLSQLAGTYSRQFFSQLGMHANDLGRLYAVAYALLLFVWDRCDRLALKAVLLAAMGLVTLALLLTFSRGAFLGFIIVNLIYLFSRRSVKTLVLATVLIPVGLAFAPGAIWSRLQMGVDKGLDEITAGRLDDIWIPILPEVLQSPPWGNGLGAVMWSRAMRFEEMFFVTHPHNAYLQAYLDLGAIGALLLIAFWVHSWWSFRGLAHDRRITPELQGFFEGAAAGVVSFLVAGIAGSSLMPVPEQSFLWLALGVMWGVKRHLKPVTPAKAGGQSLGPGLRRDDN